MTTKYNHFNDQKKELTEKRINALFDKMGAKERNVAKKYRLYLERKGLRLESQRSYMQNYFLLTQHMKAFLNPTKESIDEYLSFLNKNYKKKTIHERRMFLLYFYSFYKNKEYEKLPFLKDIKTTRDNGTKLPEELLNPSDIKFIVSQCDNFRDKALIMLLYETGARRGEFLQLQIKHIDLIDKDNKKYGFITIPMGKTTSRKVPLIFSLPHIINWLNSHPHRNDSNSPLFVRNDKNNNVALNDESIRAILRRLKTKMNFKKPLHPHIFRHSRMTELAKELTEQELKKFAGWTQNSNMASVYVHLAGEDVSNKLLANAGLIDHKLANKGKAELLSIECPSCNALNGSDIKICKCGRVLDLKEAQKEIDNYKEQSNELETLKAEMDGIKEMLKQMWKERKI